MASNKHQPDRESILRIAQEHLRRADARGKTASAGSLAIWKTYQTTPLDVAREFTDRPRQVRALGSADQVIEFDHIEVRKIRAFTEALEALPMVERVTLNMRDADGRLIMGGSKTAGEVRFIKDRGGDHNEWGWNPPNANSREIDPDYHFNAKNLEPLARVLRSALMALGHIQTARTVFTKIKGQRISPDGNIGGKGYVMPLKDIRKQFANCDEALSSITDTIYDEINATHWHPAVNDSGGDPRAREQVKEVMDDVEEIKEDPEEWAEKEEAEMDGESPGGSAGEGPDESAGVTKMASRVAALYLARRDAR
jgi:hypothetical protein